MGKTATFLLLIWCTTNAASADVQICGTISLQDPRETINWEDISRDGILAYCVHEAGKLPRAFKEPNLESEPVQPVNFGHQHSRLHVTVESIVVVQDSVFLGVSIPMPPNCSSWIDHYVLMENLFCQFRPGYEP